VANEQAALFLVKGAEDWAKFQKTDAALDFTDWHCKDFNLHQRDFLKAANFDRATFEVLVDMAGTDFQKGATFKNATFNKQVRITPKDTKEPIDFSEAEFLDDVHIKLTDSHHRLKFARAKFRKRLAIVWGPINGDLDFSAAEFHGDVTVGTKAGPISFEEAKFGVENPVIAKFSNAEMMGYANFEGARFLGPAIFDNTKFNAITSFKDCTFHVAPSFHGATLHQGTKFSHQSKFPALFRDTISADAANAYRTLKLAMNAQHAHNEELGFFLLEMRSTAPHQKWWMRPFFGLYDIVSRYGISVWRPAAFFAGFNVAFGLLYSWLAGRGWGFWEWDPELLALTLYGTVPFAPALRWETVSGAPSSNSTTYAPLFPPEVQEAVPAIVAAQGIISAALLFLVLLGIRNTFRIK
jgi:hypothetical protein